MGRREDRGLYRGDAPVSQPGYNGASPTAYTGGASSPAPLWDTPADAPPAHPPQQIPTATPMGPHANHGHPGHVSGTSSSGQHQHQHQQPPPPPSPLFVVGRPPSLQRGSAPSRRGSGGAAWGGFFLAAVAVGGFLAYENISSRQSPSVPTFDPLPSIAVPTLDFPTFPSIPGSPFDPETPAPPAPHGEVGESLVANFNGNSLQITVESAQLQPAAAWSQGGSTADRGHWLVVDLEIERVDEGPLHPSQVSWFNWAVLTEDEDLAEGELSGGGYEPALSTVNLDPGETAAGRMVFDADDTFTRLELRASGDRVVASWDLEPEIVTQTSGVLGESASTKAAEFFARVKVAAPEWVPQSEVNGVLEHGALLELDVTVRSTSTEEFPIRITPANWVFVPESDPQARHPGSYGSSGEVEAGALIIHAGELASGKIMIDAPSEPGTLQLVGNDDLPIITWEIPGPS